MGSGPRQIKGWGMQHAELGALEGKVLLFGGPYSNLQATQALFDKADALEDASDPAELLVVEVPDLPEGLLLVDAPDFDSVVTRNRDAAEALARVLDLALVVVTRHTYQNICSLATPNGIKSQLSIRCSKSKSK